MVDSAYALAMAGEMQQAIALNNDWLYGASSIPVFSIAIIGWETISKPSFTAKPVSLSMSRTEIRRIYPLRSVI